MDPPALPDSEKDTILSKEAKVEREPTLPESLVLANQQLRASIVSNFVVKGLVGLGIGTALAIFVFKRNHSSLSHNYRQGCSNHLYYWPWSGHGIFRGIADGARLSRAGLSTSRGKSAK